MKTQIIEEARGEAQKEAKKQMEAAQVAIEQARKEAELRFRDEVSAFALDIATKVVRKQMPTWQAPRIRQQTTRTSKRSSQIQA
mgnify:CR=1 FL=1